MFETTSSPSNDKTNVRKLQGYGDALGLRRMLVHLCTPIAVMGDLSSATISGVDCLLLLLTASISVAIFRILAGKLQKALRPETLRLPPGPKPWPIVGNLLQVGPVPHEGMMGLTKRYGPLVYFRFGAVPAVVTDDPRYVREFLKIHDGVMSSRPKNIASQHFTFGGKDIAFAPFGEHWKDARKLCLQELLAPKRLEFFKTGRAQEMQCMLKSVYEDALHGKAINMRDLFGALSSNTLTRMLLGKRFFGAGEAGPAEAAEHKTLIYEAFWLINAFNVGDYIPWLRPFDINGYERRMKKTMRRVNEIYDAIIQEHLLTLHHDGPKDFLHALLASQIDMLKTKAILIDMVAAGTDTSSITSEWTMAELLKHPRVMQRVQEEIDYVVGQHNRLVEEHDLNKLKYLKAIVKEVFRLHPVGAFLIPHLSMEPCKIGGYDIPKNTRILINTYALGRNPTVWSRPMDFLPERFLQTSEESDLNDPNEFRIVPFGAGRRGCPGVSLGTCVVLLGLARLIQGFNWVPFTKEDSNMHTSYGSMIKATPLHAVATPRLPHHMYL